MTDVIYVPMRRKLYDDVVRFSDGQIDPAAVAEDMLQNWIGNEAEWGPDGRWGDRFEEVAAEYAPHLLEESDQKELAKNREKYKSLVWKEVTIAAGSGVRMAYGDTHHYAKVERGAIVDDGKEYSPSEWASKIAGGTSRNAWRDLWFREPSSKTWVPAQMLRDQVGESRAKGTTESGRNDDE